jgi:hypothetical protein
MRVGSDLTTKAFLALEEALHECRYRRVERTRALRMVLAYLADQASDPKPFVTFWQKVADPEPTFRFGAADMALQDIYRDLKVTRDEALSHEIWEEVHARCVLHR